MPAVLHTPIKVLATTTTTTQPLTNTGTNDFPWSSSADGFLASLFGDERYGWSESTVSCINDGYEPTEARVCSASVAYSPVLDARGQDWHYGYGAWIECTATYDCDETTRISSPGAYGAYPFTRDHAMDPSKRLDRLVYVCDPLGWIGHLGRISDVDLPRCAGCRDAVLVHPHIERNVCLS